MSKNRRDATADEAEAAMVQHMRYWNAYNPSSKKPRSHWDTEREEAEAMGHKAEVCGSCEATFLPFHHFVRCHRKPCPMSDGVSLLERFKEG